MKCGYSKEILALYVEDDLPTPEAVEKVHSHVSACSACGQYCDQLRKSQSFIKSRFQWAERPTVNQETLAQVRRNVMAQVEHVQQTLSWALRLERFFMFALRQHRHATVAFATVVVVSASLLGQIQRSVPGGVGVDAVFVGPNTLMCPSNYREWVFLGCSSPSDPGNAAPQFHANSHNVYISRAAYREYSHSRRLPEGTVLVLEMSSADSKQLAVSVKDNRFAGGWGFFEFADGSGKTKTEADALPQTAGCVGCHRDKAATDHVFSQFYPALRDLGS